MVTKAIAARPPIQADVDRRPSDPDGQALAP
jgi:hypothetical protein